MKHREGQEGKMGKTKELSRGLLSKVLYVAVTITAAVLLLCCLTLRADAATAKVTGSSVNIRKDASTSSDKVGSAKQGDTFEIKSEKTGADGKVWYQITLNGQTGYIRSDLAQKSQDTTSAPVISMEGVSEVLPVSAKVTGNQVRVRPDASTNGSAVTTVEKDAVVTINGTAVGADGKKWYLVSYNAGSGDVQGFIREDFLSVSGELVPAGEATPEVPPVEEPSTETPEQPTVTVKDYDTYKKDGKWYLVNNTGEEALSYSIDDIFEAAKKNAELYNGSRKTVRTQKVFIIILVLLLVAGGVGATLIIFKMKDMMDEAYFEEVEKEVASKRQSRQQNVMHTVGKDSLQKKPTVNGQQRPASKPQQVGGQAKPMPKPQPGTQPRPNAAAQGTGAQSRPAGAAQNSAAQARPAGAAPVSHPRPAGAVQGTQTSVAQARPASTAQSTQAQAPQSRPASAPQGGAAPASQTRPAQQPAPGKDGAKPEWKSKNFMSDDDDFEFEFLNWDGEDDL